MELTFHLFSSELLTPELSMTLVFDIEFHYDVDTIFYSTAVSIVCTVWCVPFYLLIVFFTHCEASDEQTQQMKSLNFSNFCFLSQDVMSIVIYSCVVQN